MKLLIPGGGPRTIPYFKTTQGVREVITSQLSLSAPGAFLADRAYVLPRFDDPDFMDRFESLYEKEKFDACVPVLDSALWVFARNVERVSGKPFLLAMSPPETIHLATDKLNLADHFRRIGLPIPDTSTVSAYLARPWFPAFLKPRYPTMRDFGKAVYCRIDEEAGLTNALDQIQGREEAFVIQRLLEGEEINLDFFCDGAGQVQSVVPVARRSMTDRRAIGMGEILTDSGLGEIAWELVERLAASTPIWGPAQLQLFRAPSGEIRCTEINVRLTGSSPLVRAAGVDYYRHLVRLIQGEKIEIPERARPWHMMAMEALHLAPGPLMTPGKLDH